MRVRTPVAAAAAAIVSLALAACDGSQSPDGGTAPVEEPADAPLGMAAAVVGAANVTIDGYVLVGSRRIGRTVFEYTYTAEASNLGAESATISATLASTSASTTVVDGDLGFGAVAAGATQVSADTFTIRHDRSQPFDANALVWTVRAEGGGGGLPGEPAAPAVSATTDLGPVAAPDADILDGVILTKLDVMLAPAATVGQVNAALATVDGTLVHMRAGSPFLTVGVPRQADPPSLAALAALLQSQPGIAAAFAGREAVPRVLPPGEAGDGDFALAELEHLLPTRFPAAWNARGLLAGCTAGKLPVLIADSFGAAAPGPAGRFEAEIPGFVRVGADAPGLGSHGYDVTTTAVAGFDEQNPTGAMPFVQCLDVLGVSTAGQSMLEATSLIDAQFPAGKFILNHSMGFPDECPDLTTTCLVDPFWPSTAKPFQRAIETFSWRFATEDRWDDFVATVAAGNEASGAAAQLYPGLGLAIHTSHMALSTFSGAELLASIQDADLWGGADPFPSVVPTVAELGHVQAVIAGWGLIGGTGNPYVAAGNVLTVGSTTSGAAFADLTESDFSDADPDVSAVGEKVLMLGDAVKNGTSFSSPQVTGLVAYLWLLSPQLRALPAGQTAAAIRANARDNDNVSRVIDAYATVLSLDKAAPVSPDTAPVREAILDEDGNVLFDEQDLQAFAAAYHLDDPEAPVPPGRDYGRFDLNGDGYTGGPNTDRFDLDRTGSIQFGATHYGVVSQAIEGVDIQFDETALSDREILCYYAYSPLYVGDTDVRAAVLGPGKCMSARLAGELSAFSGTEALLTVKVTDPSGAPLAGILVEFEPTGGTVSPVSGTTDQGGLLEATVTLDDGSSGVSIVVSALGQGGQVLDRQVVTGGAAIIDVSPEAEVGPLMDTPMTISVYADGPSGITPLYNVWLDIEAMGGTLGASGGYTDFLGNFATTIRSAPKGLCVRLDITAREVPGGAVIGSRQVDLLVRTPGLDGTVAPAVFSGLASAVATSGDGSTATDSESGAVGLSPALACPPPASGVQQAALSASMPLSVGSAMATQNLRLEADAAVTQILVHADGQGTGPGRSAESSLLGAFRVTAPLAVAFTPQATVQLPGGTAWVYLTRTQSAVYGPPGPTADVQACIRATSATGTGACSTAWPTSFGGSLPPGQYYIYAGTIADSSWVMDLTITLQPP
jgi:hypothetical protein